MRILVVSNLYPPGFQGGYELGCAHMVAALGEAGHDVRVVTSALSEAGAADPPEVARVLRMGPIFDVASMAALTGAARHEVELRARGVDPENVRALEAEVASFEPDVAYLWNLLGVGGLGVLELLERRSLPWVWHLMDAVPRLLCGRGERTEPALAAAFGGAVQGRYLACSAHVLGEIRAGGVELGDAVELLPNWVAGPLPPARRDFYAGGELRLISAVGVLGEHKGTDVLIEAVALLRAAGHEDFTLDLYGREADARFRALIAARGLEDVVRLRGLLPQPELIARLADYDVFAFPTAWREPFAFAPLEAAAAGCVPLISDDSGNAEWMVGGVHCLKARRAPAPFAEAIAAILRGDRDLAVIGRRAQAIVRDQFHLPALVPRVERALAAAAAERGAASADASAADRIAKLAQGLEHALA